MRSRKFEGYARRSDVQQPSQKIFVSDISCPDVAPLLRLNSHHEYTVMPRRLG